MYEYLFMCTNKYDIMIISDSNGDININCIADDVCTQSQFILDANKVGIHNITNINCSGTYDMLYNIECNGEYACASADNINIDCTMYHKDRDCSAINLC